MTVHSPKGAGKNQNNPERNVATEFFSISSKAVQEVFNGFHESCHSFISFQVI
jgi:hypothetical protein